MAGTSILRRPYLTDRHTRLDLSAVTTARYGRVGIRVPAHAVAIENRSSFPINHLDIVSMHIYCAAQS